MLVCHHSFQIIGLEAALEDANIRVHDQAQELDRLSRRASELESTRYEQTAELHVLQAENKGFKKTSEEQVSRCKRKKKKRGRKCTISLQCPQLVSCC